MLKLTDIGELILIEDVDSVNVENRNISKENTGFSFFPDSGEFLIYSKVNKIAILLGLYDGFLKDDDSAPTSIEDAKEYLYSLFLLGEVIPNYDELVQWLQNPEGLERVDKIGERTGDVELGVYATGISQLALTDLTGLTIAEFNGTSTYSISGNSIILDPLLTFSSFVDSDGNIYSMESAHNDAIVGTQTCTIVGTPIVAKSIDYKSWRNLLGYNDATEYDAVVLRKYISDTESIEQTFSNVEIVNDDDTTFRDGGSALLVPKMVDDSGNLNNATQTVAANQPEWDDVNKAIIGNGLTSSMRLNVLPCNDCVWEVDMKFNDATVTQLMGCYSTLAANNRFYFGILSNVFVCGWNTIKYTTIPSDTSRHVFRLERSGFYIDDVLAVAISSDYNYQSTAKLQLMAVRQGLIIGNYCNADVYSSKITTNGIVVQNLQTQF